MEQEIKNELKKKLNPKFIKKRPDSGMSYVEGWHVEDEANAIFKFEWDSEILSMIENTPPTQNKKMNWVVSFRATVRVHAGGQFKDGCGYGSGINHDIHKAYEGAVKEAETDAEKRAFKKFGNRFGLALYDKAQEGVGIDEKTPEEKREAAIKWADSYMKKVDGCADDRDLMNLSSDNAKTLSALSKNHDDLSKKITELSNSKRAGFNSVLSPSEAAAK